MQAHLTQALSHWHFVCDLIFDELCAGRGVCVPDLGTFSIDSRTTFHGTAGTVTDRKPALVLSASFERLGVRFPPARPSSCAVHMLGWQQIALRCGSDRDLVRRSVSAVLASFASQIAGMTATGARSTAGLDLGRCGKLRIMRSGEMRSGWLEPRVLFAQDLVTAVSRGALVAHSIKGMSKGGASAAVADEKPKSTADKTLAGVAADGYVSLERLSQLMAHGMPEWATCVRAAEAGKPSRVGAETSAALQATADAHEVEQAASVAASVTGANAAALEALPPPQAPPLLALPQTAPSVDEWAVSKQLAWTCDVMGGKMLPAMERARKAEIDRANLQEAVARRQLLARAAWSSQSASPEVAGVVKLLRRLGPRAEQVGRGEAKARETEASETGLPALLTHVAGTPSESADDERSEVSVEIEQLLERKRELERRLERLEERIEVGSVSSRGSRRSYRSAASELESYAVAPSIRALSSRAVSSRAVSSRALSTRAC